MKNTLRVDSIVIGSGPGGEGAAMQLAKAGHSVAIAERYTSVGGGCTHWGTIPSKALRHSVQSIVEFKSDPLFAKLAPQIDIDFVQLLSDAKDVIQSQVETRSNHYARNKVQVIQGNAQFIDAHSVMITDEDQNKTTVTFGNAVIATGSRPYHPGDIDFSHPRILDADTVLDLQQTPSSITIYGAGVIGCEYASIFTNLGVRVNLINTRNTLLSFLDNEITDALSYHLRDQGVTIRHNEEVDTVVADDSGVMLNCLSGKKIHSDVLLWANGRSGNAHDLNVEALGVEVNHREQVVVNESFQSAVAHIYAIGDVVGPPGLASASYDQGRFAGTVISKSPKGLTAIQAAPTGIYTSPEISSIGLTEKQLTEDKVPYEVAKAGFKSIARAQITKRNVGMLKILFHRKTLAILGVHCFGDNAAEIIHIGQAIMQQKGKANTLKYFAETTFNYPTMAEAYRVAALNGLNKIKQT
ncbi:MAG: NAD(P) transhydrogenase [Parvicella sp.]|jgi:NAD(P) transhydrogenase